jgi:V/A-type H+-transporting ATPase subunit E
LTEKVAGAETEEGAMPEDLQALIDHLQRDAVAEGKRRADALVETARAEADATVREAEARAAEVLADAETEAQRRVERGTVALEQAGRDLLITLQQAIRDLFARLVREELDDELRPDLLGEMLTRMAEAYTAHGARERRMAVLLSEDDLDALAQRFTRRLRETLGRGVELRLDGTVRRGFRVEIVDEHVTHDFTADAIAEVLTDYLRPRLAEMLPRIAVDLAREDEGRADTASVAAAPKTDAAKGGVDPG